MSSPRKSSLEKLTKVISFQVFSYLHSMDLLLIKNVCKNLKMSSEEYLKESKDNIFYAVSFSKIAFGREKLQYDYISELLIDKTISAESLLRTYKYVWEYEYSYHNWGDATPKKTGGIRFKPIDSMRLFLTEEDALRYLRQSKDTLYERDFWGSNDDFSFSFLRTTPIYKVQCIHSTITLLKDHRHEKKNVKVTESKDALFYYGRNVNTVNLIPLSATVKFSLNQGRKITTIVQDLDLRKNQSLSR